METQSIKKSLTKVALLSALGVGGMTAMNVSQNVAHADTRVDATHIKVDAGDSLYKIAQNHGTTVSQLVANNHIANPNLIQVGEILSINGQDNNNSQAAATTTQATQPAAQNTQSNYSTSYASNAQPSAAVQSASAGYNAGNYNGNNNYSNYTSSISGSDADAKAWIAARESGGNYGARNGQYIGKYQLSASYLNGDYSPANQERVADQYCQQRYGSWSAAKAHWEQNGWW